MYVDETVLYSIAIVLLKEEIVQMLYSLSAMFKVMCSCNKPKCNYCDFNIECISGRLHIFFS